MEVSKNMSEEKYILILGAGLMQRPAIEAVKNLGYKTLIVDANPNAVCVPFADRFEPIDLKDREELAALALSLGEKLAAVFTAGTDFSASVSYVAEKAHLPSHSFEAACNASNKVSMRRCFEKAGVSSPSFQEVERSKIASFLLPGMLDEMTFPKVVKPVDNMGARGCRMIRNKSEFLAAIEDAVRYSRCGRAILEDYMDGPEFSIDALVYKGTLTITGFADRHIFYQPYFIETGHTMPTAVDEKKRLELIACFAKAVDALGLTCGAAKADIKYTAQGPMIGEIAARLSGGYMSGWTYPYASDLALTEQAILIALGKEPTDLLLRRKPLPIKNVPFGIYEVPCLHTSAERAWISIPGTVASLSGTDFVSAIPYTRNILLRSYPGSIVTFPRNNVEKCGNVIAVANSRELAVQAAERGVSGMVLRLRKDNKETERFLSGVALPTEDHFPPDAFVLPQKNKRAFETVANRLPPVTGATPVLNQSPDCLKELFDSLKDWNHRTIRETLCMYERLCPKRPVIAGTIFWKALVRGGLQGILYVTDSAATEKTATRKTNRK